MARKQAPRHWYAKIDGVEIYDGERRADELPEDHPLVELRLACEESNELIKQAGDRTFRIDWVETGFYASHPGEGEEHPEQQVYCGMHFHGRGDVYPVMNAHMLLDD